LGLFPAFSGTLEIFLQNWETIHTNFIFIRDSFDSQTNDLLSFGETTANLIKNPQPIRIGRETRNTGDLKYDRILA
jgi:hypothetical protein